MNQSVFGISLDFILVTFVSVFTIVNPTGAMSLFVAHVSELPDIGIKRLARKASLATAGVLVFFAVTGSQLFRLLGIGIPSFRIAGGILLFMVSLDMLKGQNVRSRTLPEEQLEAEGKEDISLIPLAFPLLAGPGAITAVIVLMTRAKTFTEDSIVIGSIFLTSIITYFTLAHSPFLLRAIGASGARVMNRLMGLVLAGISIQFVINGLKELMPEFAQILAKGIHPPGF